MSGSLFGYAGPTLIVVESTKGDVFGCVAAEEWKEHVDFFGENAAHESFLFSLRPKVSIYRPRGAKGPGE